MTFNGIMLMVGFFGVPIVVLISILGIRKNEGIWGNTISIVNISFAALIAINYWEDLASILANSLKIGLFYWDYVAVWLLYLVSYFLLDEVSRRLTRVKVKFPAPIEQIGGPVSGIVLFIAFYLFYSFTMHLGPIGDPREPGQQIPAYDIVRAKSYDFLSSGNLAPFSNTNVFDSDKVFRDQNARRAAMLYTANSTGLTRFEGDVPKRN